MTIPLSDLLHPSDQSSLLLGDSAPMVEVRRLLRKVADTDVPVMLLGESGTGKELAAKTLHWWSKRSGHPFVTVNCAAIPEDLLESEMFGHDQGAFTGATRRRIGKFRAADGGTLFLDEIAAMSPKLQAKLLRVLQDQEFSPVGSDVSVRTNARIVSATSHDIPCAIQEGKFRADLWYRLNVFSVQIPPLRERGADVLLLLVYFLVLFGSKYGKQITEIEESALYHLCAFSWPGNVRELEHAILRLVILSEDGVLRDRDLSGVCLNGSLVEELPQEGIDMSSFARRKLEEEMIRQAMARTSGNKTEAAKLLGMNRTALAMRLQRITRRDTCLQ